MNNNKIFLIIGIVVLVLFIIGKKVKNLIDVEKEFKAGLLRLKKEFGATTDELKWIERLYRNETAHFKSGQFKKSYSPGMEKFSDKYPYGWNTLYKTLWIHRPDLAPDGYTSPLVEGQNTGKMKVFLTFPTLYAAMASLYQNYLNRDKNWFAWHSLNSEAQAEYKRRLETIKPKFALSI